MDPDKPSLAELLEPAVRADPYPFYRRLREADRVFWDEGLGLWALTHYADVASALHDSRFSRADGLAAALERLPPETRQRAEPVYRMFGRQMVHADPPYHTRLRGLVNKAFTPRIVEGMQPGIQNIVDTLLDQAETSGTYDVMAGLAYPLPLTVTLDLLGLPREKSAEYKTWSDGVFGAMGMVRREPHVFETAGASIDRLTADLHELRDKRQAEPREDLFSALVAAEEQGEKLTRDELMANTILLLGAGHETTTDLIGNGLLALLRNPDQMALLRAEPSLIAGAVDEMMRYDNPVQIVWRYVNDEVEVGGARLRRGDFANVMVGAANRDPDQFPDPDRLDLRRPISRHAGFGLGIHFCVGAPLARLEGQIALGTLLRRFPKIELASGSLEWRESPTFHGLKSLPVYLA